MPFDIAQLAEGARAALHRLLAAIPSHRRTPKPLSLGLVLDQRLKSAVSLVTDVQSLRAEVQIGLAKMIELSPFMLLAARVSRARIVVELFLIFLSLERST